MPDIEAVADPAAPTYFNNTKAMPRRDALFLVGASVVMLAGKLLGYLPVDWAIVFAPAGFVLVASFLFGLIRNAVHEGERLFYNDMLLDEQAAEAVRRAEEAHLTPDKLVAKLGEVTE